MTDIATENGEPYLQPARLFNLRAGIPTEENRQIEYVNRMGVIVEEVEELYDEVVWLHAAETHEHIDNEDRIVEELADVLFTVMSFADAMDIDIREAYRRKAQYNLEKSGNNAVNGKVEDAPSDSSNRGVTGGSRSEPTEDADVDKPDFGDLVGV